MIKARAAAGDLDARPRRSSPGSPPYVYPEHLEPAAIDDVRRTKVRLEEYIRQRGKELTEVKRGRGGIRDVEFAVQLLQIVHGRRNPALRSPNTLAALQALADEGYVAEPDADGARRGVPVPAAARAPAADRPRPADPRPAGRPARPDDDRALARACRRRASCRPSTTARPGWSGRSTSGSSTGRCWRRSPVRRSRGPAPTAPPRRSCSRAWGSRSRCAATRCSRAWSTRRPASARCSRTSSR